MQDSSTGLPVNEAQPLPIFPENDPTNCENPLELEVKTSFEPRDIRMLGRDEKTTTLPSTIIKPL